jgi:5-formyltetrahydrofolate cyclo-ligase
MASSYGEDASKSALRESYLRASKGLTPRYRKRVDREVRLHLRTLPEYLRADWLLAYVPFEDEFPTRDIVTRALADGKRVALPRCEQGVRGSRLSFYGVDSLEGLVAGTRGVLEPVPAEGELPLGPDELGRSICLVPGLVFDAEGYRIGYGAGYYDDFLAGYPGLKVGLARTMQISGNPLPHDDHDVPVDVIVSDGAVWRARRVAD